MKLKASVRLVAFTVFCLLAPSLFCQTPQYPNYPSETPSSVQQKYDDFDFVRRDVMIPMRDGVRLHTVILVPKGAKNAPILLTRTPYDADRLTTHTHSSHLGLVLDGYDNSPDIVVE